MATRIRYTVHDDLDASTDGVGTYRFALEGREYEIDLSEANLDRLRAALAEFIAAGRRLSKAGKTRQRTGPGALNGRFAVVEVRNWWFAQWQQLNLPEPKTRGAIPARVRAAYDAARTPGTT